MADQPQTTDPSRPLTEGLSEEEVTAYEELRLREKLGNWPAQTTTIQVAIYWPGEGYGIPESAPDMDTARRMAERWRQSSREYAGSKGEIHIIKTVREVTVYGE